ncbi:MAG: alginate O-acetyltransferase complex protein AlgI [Halioglobus sp.]|jgi:alginate O-acetyltransferase complex protein AlgI
MLFNSIEFLFFFLPMVLAGFLLLQRIGNLRLIMLWLTACSLFFYAWWNPIYLLLLLVSGGVNYTLGGILAKGGKEQGHKLLVLGVCFNLGLLAYFKYGNFFLENAGLAMDWSFNFEHIILPLAISFYTFQQITYLVDTRKGLTASHGFIEYILFVSFFPQLIAGPIVHHSEMLSQFSKLTDRSRTYSNLIIGFSILSIGLFKKVVIADGLALFATPVFDMALAGEALYTMDAVVGAISYTLQIYFDFSGYSDMAIGLACLFGMKLPVNFMSPYKSTSIAEYWRTWHITLSRFLREYLYIALGGNRKGATRRYVNLFLTMLLGGVWHGAGWSYFVWGALHGSYLIINHFWGSAKEKLGFGFFKSTLYLVMSWAATFVTLTLSFIIFRAETLTSGAHVLRSIFNWNGGQLEPAYQAKLELTNSIEFSNLLFNEPHILGVIFVWLAVSLAICLLLPNTFQLFRDYERILEPPLEGRRPFINLRWSATTAWAVFIALLAVASLTNLTQVTEFLYFQF